MKFRIIATLVALAVFACIWLAVEYTKQDAPAPGSGRPDANDFRNLKIN